MNVPDVIGYYLYEAKEILELAGINISSIKVTAPPRALDKEFDDSYRIIWQDSKNLKNIDLLVCKPL
jgi:hypothetical protein